MNRVRFLGAVITAVCLIHPAFAADLAVRPVYKSVVQWAPTWFVEANVGGSWAKFDDLRFLNPIGAANGALTPAGSYILLSNRELSDTSWTGGVSVGYFLTRNFFAKVAYQYVGRFRASGFAAFAEGGADPTFRQDLTTDAHALLFELGADFDINQVWFVEAIGGIGAGFLHSTGRQGANLGLPNAFPAADNTTFAATVGAGIGIHWTRNIDVLLNGNYYWLGKADTGVTGNPPPPGMNPGEQLQSKLNVFTATVGARARF